MSQTFLPAPEHIDREDIETRWKTLTNDLGNQGRRLEIKKEDESQNAEEKQLGVKKYEFSLTIAGRDTVIQTIHDTSVRWHASFFIRAAESKKAKTAFLQVKYHMFNTIEKVRISGTESELRMLL